MFKHKIFASLAIVSIFGLAACGGSSSDEKDGTVTTLAQKNAALSMTTLVPTTAPKTVTTPVPKIPLNSAPRPTTPSVRATTTSVVKTVTTPMPSLPKR